MNILTPDLGLVRALSQGVRKSGAKLAHSLSTFSESEVVLVRGKDGWRLTGAILSENWFARLGHSKPRVRAARVCSLVLRLIVGEENASGVFSIIKGFFEALSEFQEDSHEAVEILAALRILATLGFDAGEIPGEASVFTRQVLTEVAKRRVDYITRINNGIDASGL